MNKQISNNKSFADPHFCVLCHIVSEISTGNPWLLTCAYLDSTSVKNFDHFLFKIGNRDKSIALYGEIIMQMNNIHGYVLMDIAKTNKKYLLIKIKKKYFLNQCEINGKKIFKNKFSGIYIKLNDNIFFTNM